MKMKKIFFLILIISTIASGSCQKDLETMNPIIANWELDQVFLGYFNGGDFVWRKTSDRYNYNLKANDSVYSTKFITSCRKGIYSLNGNNINLIFDCGNGSVAKEDFTYSFNTMDTLLFQKKVDEGYIQYKFYKSN